MNTGDESERPYKMFDARLVRCVHPPISEQMYVRIATGDHAGLYGWVKAHVSDGARCYVAVGDSRYKASLYQWFDVAHIIFEDEDERGKHVQPRPHRLRKKPVQHRRQTPNKRARA